MEHCQNEKSDKVPSVFCKHTTNLISPFEVPGGEKPGGFMENVVNAEFSVIKENLEAFTKEALEKGASKEDASSFQEEVAKQTEFFKACLKELGVRAKNGKSYVKDLCVAFWNKIKDLASRVFKYCKDVYEKVKAYVLNLFQ